MRDSAKRNFILQQGFEPPEPGTCSREYTALRFQPWIVLVWLLGAIFFQSPAAFFVLAAVLWWSALFPALNPFDALYNSRGRSAGFHLTPAPPPRRTAQAMAGGFALTCALLVRFDLPVAAYIVEGLFLAAVLALTLGGFCLGSFVYHLSSGRGAFARRTLPWAR